MKSTTTLALLCFVISGCGIADGPSIPYQRGEDASSSATAISTIAESTPSTGFFQGGLVMDSHGNLFASINNFGINKYTSPDWISTPFESTLFTDARGLAIDSADSLYATDSATGTIFKVTSAGVVTPFAGVAGVPGEVNGPVNSAQFNAPQGIAVNLVGDVFVSDTGGSGTNHLRKISGGTVTSIASIPDAMFSIAVDIAGNVYGVSVADHRLYKFSPPSYDTVVLAGSGVPATTDGIGTAASFNGPMGVTVDRSGTIYVAEAYGNVIRKVTATGIVTTYAGSGTAATTDGSLLSGAFNQPGPMVITNGGTLFVMEVGPPGMGGGNILRRVN